MSRLTVHLFGRFRVFKDDQQLTSSEHAGGGSAKAHELLAYLLLNRTRPRKRETLADLLWGDSAGLQARKYLRQALWRLQSSLGEHIFCLDQDWVSIDPAADIRTDVMLLESAHEQSRGIAGHELSPHQAAAVREAIRVYHGDLLEGWPNDWCVYERERLQLLYLQLLDKLMAFCEARTAYDEAIECAQQILRYDRARERTHRDLMRLHDLEGHRSAAVRQYARCVAALREELDVAPAAKTTALYQQILGGSDGDHEPERVAGSLAALRDLLVGFDAHVRTALDQLDRLSARV